MINIFRTKRKIINADILPFGGGKARPSFGFCSGSKTAQDSVEITGFAVSEKQKKTGTFIFLIEFSFKCEKQIEEY